MTKSSSIHKAFDSFQGTLALAKACWVIADRTFWAAGRDRDVLKASPSAFFVPAAQASLRGCVQAIRTMSDRRETMGRDNVSAEGLVDALASTDPSLMKALKDFESAAASFRELANRAVAHDDWRAASGDEVPKEIEKVKVSEALAAADAFADAFSAASGLRRTPFDPQDTESAMTRVFDLLEIGLRGSGSPDTT